MSLVVYRTITINKIPVVAIKVYWILVPKSPIKAPIGGALGAHSLLFLTPSQNLSAATLIGRKREIKYRAINIYLNFCHTVIYMQIYILYFNSQVLICSFTFMSVTSNVSSNYCLWTAILTTSLYLLHFLCSDYIYNLIFYSCSNSLGEVLVSVTASSNVLWK